MARKALIPPLTGRLGLEEFVEPVVYATVADRFGVDLDLLGADVAFARDLAADALDVLELAIALEQRFAVDIPERDIDRVRTLGDVVRVLVARLFARDHPGVRPLPRRPPEVVASARRPAA
jgi:acyl carrier protein